ncbi:hypothetical protein ACFSJM_04835 [Lactococcus formosensis subsp. bovis]|uniref:hypothetical protein n=1 Tax=Lactococcus formosensis TaxID=1281486 RepID=UPI001BCA8E87|nr:hypothetical protein [Lactococcus formosensis]
MNKQNQETTFKQSLKNTSIVVAIIILLRLIKKLIFKFQETKEFFNEILFSNSPFLYRTIVVCTVILAWVLVSLLGASVYYFYKKVIGK